MIKTEELRIGNLVTDKFYESFGTIITVESISSNGINLEIENDGNYPEIAQRWIQQEYSFSDLFGIPLTDEWLEDKFCFYFRYDEWRIEMFDGYDELLSLRWDNEREVFCLSVQTIGHCVNLGELKYVHQLQNLFYAITGKQLEIKEDHENI